MKYKNYIKEYLELFDRTKEDESSVYKNLVFKLDFINKLGDVYIPSNFLIKKAEAMILLGEDNYSITEVREFLEFIKAHDSLCFDTYLFLGSFYNNILKDKELALEVVDEGISNIKKLKKELREFKKELILWIEDLNY